MRGDLWRTYIPTLIGRLKPMQAWQQAFSVMCNAEMMRCRVLAGLHGASSCCSGVYGRSAISAIAADKAQSIVSRSMLKQSGVS